MAVSVRGTNIVASVTADSSGSDTLMLMTAASYTIRKLESEAELALCASMMLDASPWNRLSFSKEQCTADLANPLLRIYGAVAHDGTILGFAASMECGIGLEPMIEYLCVREQFRNMGIGTTLIDHFENQLFPDADNLYLFVSDINPDAMRLYVRLGYLQIGALANFNLVGQTEFLHRKTRRPRQEAAALATEPRAVSESDHVNTGNAADHRTVPS